MSIPTPSHQAGASSQKTIVIKLGTSSILSESTEHPKIAILSSLVETCHTLRSAGHKVVIVCSGAIGMGRLRMHIKEKPKSIGERQALAALGQLRLIALWDSLFGTVGIDVAQVLLTKNDIADRPRYQNARTTLQTLLSPPFNSIPIVNENDTVSVSELRFGDNDTLSAITAGLVNADYLFLCTDVDGLYTGNPRSDPNARRLGVVKDVASARKSVSVATMGSSFGTGGMQTKLIAAELATAAGVATVILNGSTPENMIRIVEAGIPAIEPLPTAVSTSREASDSMASSITSLASEEAALIGYPPLDSPPHTLFLPTPNPLSSRKWSILHALHPAGTIIIDEGAFKRIARHDSGGRLLPAGVVGVEGTWERMQAVRLVVRRKKTSGSASTTNAAAGASAPTIPASSALSSKQLDHYLRSTDVSEGARTPPVIDCLRKVDRSGSPRASEINHPYAVVKDANATLEGIGSEWELIEVGRGLANYNSIESERIKGIKSSQITTVLGYTESDYMTDQVALHTTSLP
ncbi:putative PRO1-glutamate 5-kinase [Violaceomyces palustris]|uniref:PRO1-glutamate 5-kinase n=1 Tax=Violaceomyces palustris TaxID=1673888 RepID=A0ACD0NRJ1_9BASI|nr:putative PRO1-glutamate 5-kinase [Violaceomyces palustris]